MGEISDYYRKGEELPSEPEWGETNPIWCTMKGKWVRVKDMSTMHILNTIRCWQGLGLTKVPKGYLGGKMKWMDIFTKELMRRDENKNN